MVNFDSDYLPDSNLLLALGIVTVLSAIAAFGVDYSIAGFNPVDYQTEGMKIMPLAIIATYLISDKIAGEMNTFEQVSFGLPTLLVVGMTQISSVQNVIMNYQPLSAYVLVAMVVHAFYNLTENK